MSIDCLTQKRYVPPHATILVGHIRSVVECTIRVHGVGKRNAITNRERTCFFTFDKKRSNKLTVYPWKYIAPSYSRKIYPAQQLTNSRLSWATVDVSYVFGSFYSTVAGPRQRVLTLGVIQSAGGSSRLSQSEEPSTENMSCNKARSVTVVFCPPS